MPILGNRTLELWPLKRRMTLFFFENQQRCYRVTSYQSNEVLFAFYRSNLLISKTSTSLNNILNLQYWSLPPLSSQIFFLYLYFISTVVSTSSCFLTLDFMTNDRYCKLSFVINTKKRRKTHAY